MDDDVQDRHGQVMSRDTAKWQQTLNIWIGRTKEALQRSRILEEALREAVSIAESGAVPAEDRVSIWRSLLD